MKLPWGFQGVRTRCGLTKAYFGNHVEPIQNTIFFRHKEKCRSGKNCKVVSWLTTDESRCMVCVRAGRRHPALADRKTERWVDPLPPPDTAACARHPQLGIPVMLPYRASLFGAGSFVHWPAIVPRCSQSSSAPAC